jgi:hypothetical protein
MKLKVTQRGVTVPRRMFGEVSEVEIRSESGRVVLTPVLENDPIFSLGDEPVTTGTSDGAEHHDRYLYSSDR